MTDVYLYIYDLSMGLAKSFSQVLVGRQFDGVWHTSVVVYGTEYFFSQSGICSCLPGSLSSGQIHERKLMGKTTMTPEGLRNYLNGLQNTYFKPGSYDLLKHNCNTFSAHAIKHLTGEEIPAHIASLPSDFLDTPIGASMKVLMENVANIDLPRITSNPGPASAHHLVPDGVNSVLFDEPLSSDYLPDELTSQFSGCSGLASQWSTTALTYLLTLSSPKLTSEDVPPEAMSLLKFNRWATFRQCESICEVFRLAVWRCPELIISLLTDPNKSLYQLAAAFPEPKGQISQSLYFDLDAAKARLLCNIFALSNDWNLSGTPFLPLGPVAALCNRLIAKDDGAKPLPRSPEHEMMGFALTLDLALCPQLEEHEALEVAASLFHLLEIKKTFKHPGQAHYVLQAVYAFLTNFPSLVDLAKVLNVVSSIHEVSSQAENVQGEPSISRSHVESVHALSEKVTQLLSD